MISRRTQLPMLTVASIAALVGYAIGTNGRHVETNARAETASEKSPAHASTLISAPSDALPVDRNAAPVNNGKYPATYFPNKEVLGEGEMGITILGTGMPDQTRAAVSIPYLVELGNGDKFLFDVGSGMIANLFSLRPDFPKIDKVFVSHLHVDHVGDFMQKKKSSIRKTVPRFDPGPRFIAWTDQSAIAWKGTD